MTQQIEKKLHFEKPKHYDQITQNIQTELQKLYKSLPKKGTEQENEWSVLASFIACNKETLQMTILTFGTGSKSVTSKQYGNDIVNDCHAETVSKRSFQLFLMNEITHPQFIERNQSTNKWKWKSSEYQLIFYVTQVPCGDCCISENATKEMIETGAKRICDNSIEKTIALWEEKNIKDGIGKTRIKPGRGEKSLSKSCSDKIVKWEILGIQGGLLSNIFEPILIDLILIEEPGDEYSVNRGLNERAVHLNTELLMKKQQLYKLPPVCLVKSSGIVKQNDGKLSAAGSSINYIRNLKEEVTIATRGVKFGAGKKVNDSMRSRLCTMKMRKEYLMCLNNCLNNDNKDEKEQNEIKEIIKNEDYMKRKELFKQFVDGGWTIKPEK